MAFVWPKMIQADVVATSGSISFPTPRPYLENWITECSSNAFFSWDFQESSIEREIKPAWSFIVSTWEDKKSSKFPRIERPKNRTKRVRIHSQPDRSSSLLLYNCAIFTKTAMVLKYFLFSFSQDINNKEIKHDFVFPWTAKTPLLLSAVTRLW